MTDAASCDYSWSVPNRRFIDSGLYLPSIRSDGIDTIAVIIDTSGSVPAQTLAEFWTELRKIAGEIRPERVFVLQVDAALRNAAEYTADDLPDEIAIMGRGGTDFRPGFEWLDEQGIQPRVCLYFTDMECSSYPESRPSFDVIWVSYGSLPSERNREPWGERIDIGPLMSGRGRLPEVRRLRVAPTLDEDRPGRLIETVRRRRSGRAPPACSSARIPVPAATPGSSCKSPGRHTQGHIGLLVSYGLSLRAESSLNLKGIRPWT